ncbi:MAG: sugar transferase [Acidaminococcaceae bacterium]|nr:sugar transferase [Acidaminococcaceae bacterium]
MDTKFRLFKLFNLILMTMPIAYVWQNYYAIIANTNYYFWGNVGVVLLFTIIYMLYTRTYDALQVGFVRLGESFFGQALSVVFSDFFWYVIVCLLSKKYPSLWWLLGAFVVQLVLAFLWSKLCYIWYYSVHKPLPTMVVYDEREGMDALIGKYGMDRMFNVERTITVADVWEHTEYFNDIKAVFLSGVHSHDRNIILKKCVEYNINCYMIPRIGDTIVNGAVQMHMFHLPILRVGRYHPKAEYLVLKRVFDIVSSGVVLILISPIFLGTALAVKLQDGGPVFYRQARLTKDGKIFNVLKFRSMRVDAESDGVARLSSGENDDRITPIGKFIRKCRIDELPQLLNIIGGSMSVVGPRPERPEIAEQYEKTMPEFKLRLQVKAGLTGYAQVYGKYNTAPYDKLLMDLMYISKPSFFEDLRIIFATIKILFVGESTEGVEKGKVTAE